MNTATKFLSAVVLSVGLLGGKAVAQTDGAAVLETTLLDYNGSGTRHYTVVWVTTASGTFIKSLRKQGPSSWTSGEWGNHCGTWNTARAGSTVIDGYTSATAANYTGTNSPVIVTWNGRDASNALMPDGNYRFWVQYAENSGQGPVTTGGLLWTKGAAGATNTYPNQGANFSNMKVTWSPAGVTPVAPTITSAALPGTGTVGTAYSHTVTATGTAPITFSASGLPNGVTIDPASGAVSGTPTTAGTFNGTITAANGTLPNATQAFSVVISAAPVAPTITSAALPGTGTVGTAYSHTVTATGTAPITFSATGLPDGVSLDPATGVISGIPTTAGTNTGTITAANGTLPDATQAFSVVISAAAPVAFVSVGLESAGLVVGGTGPANGVYHVLSTTDPTLPIAQWTVVATNSIDGSGGFRFTNTVDAGVVQRYYKLRLP